MQPTNSFPEANATVGHPEMRFRAFMGHVKGGSYDGAKMCITAWKPNAVELEAIKAGQPVFITIMGGLPAHFVTTNFNQASHPI